MTVIAVRKSKSEITLASDSQINWGHRHKSVDSNDKTTLDFSKIFKINKMVWGCSGKASEVNLLKLFCKTTRPKSEEVDDILEFMVSFSDWAKKKNSNFDLDGSYILVFKGKIFQILEYDVQEVNEYNAVGSGMFVALGAMFIGATAEKAVEASKEIDLFCSGETKVIKVKI